MTEVLLDTSYAIALSVSNDEHHECALRLAGQLEAEGTGLITTRAIVLEIGNALAGSRYRKAAVQLLDALENDPQVEVVPITEELCARAFELYRNRPDKDWSLIDCIGLTQCGRKPRAGASVSAGATLLHRRVSACLRQSYSDYHTSC